MRVPEPGSVPRRTPGRSPGAEPATGAATTTRRAVLGAAAAGLLLAACDAPSRQSPASPSVPAGPASALADADPDAAAVEAAVLESAGLLALVRGVRRRHPRLALDGLVDLHRAHLRALEGDERSSAPPSPSAAGVPRREARALAEVLGRERAAAARLADAAVTARSGPLARLLASMSAGTTAHVAALEATGAAA